MFVDMRALLIGCCCFLSVAALGAHDSGTTYAKDVGVQAVGWVDSDNDRRLVATTEPLWSADLSKGGDAFRVERRDGAVGEVAVSNGVLRIEKTNDCGEIAVFGTSFPLVRGKRVRACARVSCTNAMPFASTAAVKVIGPKEQKGLSGLDRQHFGAKGPRVSCLVNTPPGTTETKFGHYEAWGVEGQATSVIVVGGRRSTSWWRDWAVESEEASEGAWRKAVAKGRPKDRKDEAMDETAFAAALATEPDHTAKVASVDGVPRLLVDGKVDVPVVYKGRNIGFKFLQGRYPFAGRRMENEAEVRLQAINVVGGRTPNFPNGFWTKEGYDAQGAVESIRTAMRISPQSLFILSLSLVPYPEFASEHPDEAWRDKSGRLVYGNESVIYGTAATFADIPSNRWAWISYSSPAWRSAVKANVAALVAELKRTGLVKRIVGIHTCGFCDWQFGTSDRPDGSQAEPTFAQNEIARFAKRCFGKDIVAIRWCFSAFSGAHSGSYDIGAFCDSDALDILVAQPMYIHRAPGVPLGLRLPTASFALHDKLFVNEFDLRTDLTLEECGSSEADAVGMGVAKGLDMWRSVYRRAAGQMMARDSGWWFFDMAGGWYDDPGIAADIGASVRACRRLLAAKPTAWRPTAAVLIDEAGSLAAIEKKLPGRDFNAYHAVLAASGVPYDTYLAEDFLRQPERVDAYRAVVWFGLNDGDGRRQVLLGRMKGRGTRVVLPAELATVTPEGLHRLAREAGVSVPCARFGLQVDMNGSFASVHCLVPGRYDFCLPSGDVRKLDLVAGETRWLWFDEKGD